MTGGDTGGDEPRPAARLEAVVHGRVQGVGFRLFVTRRAAALRLVGTVANELRGTVRVVAEGPVEALQALAADLRQGPPGARVDRVDEGWGRAIGGLRDFEVRSGWHRGD